MPSTKSGNAAKGTGSIRKKTVSKGGKEYTYWEARVTVGYDPGTGRQIQRSITGKTQKDVAQAMQAMTVDVATGNYQPPSKITVSEWLDIWLAEYMLDKKYLTRKNYKAQVETHIRPALGAVKLQHLTPSMIQAFYSDCLQHGRSIPIRDNAGKPVRKDGKIVYSSGPMQPKSVHNIHGVLSKALSVAVNIGYLRSNPADNVTLPRTERKELSPLNDEQVKVFLQAAPHNQYGVLFKVILFTGLRESEAIGLTWDCVDFSRGTLNITKQLQKRRADAGGNVFASLKSGKPRLLKPAPSVMELLSQQWAEQERLRILMGSAWQGWSSAEERATSLVFTTPNGKNISTTTVRYHFKKLVTEIGIPECRVHDLRHTFAVLSLQNGDDVKTVQGNLGHASAAFTLDVYGHVSERMKDESAARMEAYITEVQDR